MLTREEILQAAEASGATSTNALSEYLEPSRTTLRRLIAKYEIETDLEWIYRKNGSRIVSRDPIPTPKITRTGTDSGETVTSSKGTEIRTLEDLLEAAAVDLDAWRVKNYTVNKWDSGENTNFQVKAALEPRREVFEIEEIKREAVEAMKAHAPAPVRRYKFVPNEGLAMEIEIPDLHLGKLAHAEETGDNYDAKIAIAALRYVRGTFLTHAQHLGVGRFIFPIGNDLLHVDSAENETTKGTRQDVDTRSYRSRQRARDLMVETIDAMLQIAPVDGVIIPGNHAREQEAMLGEVLGAWYRKEDRFTLHDSPAARKYLQHGKTLLGFTHGDGAKAADLPLLMATEAPKMWAETRFRTWAIGHTHSRRSKTFGALDIQEHKGVEVRTGPSLSGTDAWHYSKGFVGNLRAAEAYVHDLEAGEIARYRAALPEDFAA